ncbi:MAG TPA: SRPBCC family protein [Terriglobales bacterium]
MQTTSLPPRDDNTIEASVTIKRPVKEIFSFHRDFKNLPSFLGDVMAIEQIGPATSRWTIQGPLGIRVNWTVKVTEERTNELIRYETVTSPALRTYWEIHFAPGSKAGDTEVREVMKIPLGRLGRVALALIGKFPAEEVSSNLHRLKEVMETGRVTDTSYSVPGKFPQPLNQHELKK